MEFFSEHFSESQLPKLRRQPVFAGLEDNEIKEFIAHSDPRYVELKTGRILRISPELSNTIGIVLSGSCHIYSVDYDGGRILLRTLNIIDNSGSLYSMLDFENSLIEIEAVEPFEMLLIEPESVLITVPEMAAIQHRMAVNILGTQRNMFRELVEHIACLSQRGIKDKILRYLRYQSEENRSVEFEIPLSREEMANYLAVDRAALSRSLGELRADGVIDFKKNRFKVLDTKYFKY